MPIHHQHPPREKWSLGMIMFAVGGAVLATLLVYAGLRVVLGGSPPDQPGQIARAGAMYDLNVSYPVLKTGAVDASLKAFAEKQTDEFVTKIKDQHLTSRSKLTLAFEVPHYGEKTLSAVFTKTEEIAGQEPTNRKYWLNFDLDSGKLLSLGDLFRQDADARGMLATVLHDYFRYDQSNILNSDQLARLRDMPLDSIRNFLLYEDRIAFYVDPKDPTNTTVTEPITIHKTVLAPVLNEPYAGADAAHKPDMVSKPAFAVSELPTLPPPPPAVASSTGGGRIALTFDDGPSIHTPRLLDALTQHQSQATFYVLGYLAQRYSGDLQRMVQGGHEIGNHTWLHARLTTLGGPQLDHEIGDTQRIIQQVAGYTPRTLRPPYGATNDTVAAYATKWGLYVIMWNVDPNDWQIHNSQTIYDHIMSSAADGRVILLHDIYGSSVDAAIRAIPDLKARGFQLVTVSELYGI